MLKPAILYKDQLEKLQSIIIEKEDIYKYYINNSYVSYNAIKLADSDYNEIQKVSVNSKDEVIGFFRADINAPNYIGSLGYVNFYTDSKKLSYTFAKDALAFIDYLFNYKKVSHIQFCVVIGNPAEKIYDSFIQKMGGRVVGIFKKSSQLIDQSIHDVKWYEIERENYKNDISAKR